MFSDSARGCKRRFYDEEDDLYSRRIRDDVEVKDSEIIMTFDTRRGHRKKRIVGDKEIRKSYDIIQDGASFSRDIEPRIHQISSLVLRRQFLNQIDHRRPGIHRQLVSI